MYYYCGEGFSPFMPWKFQSLNSGGLIGESPGGHISKSVIGHGLMLTSGKSLPGNVFGLFERFLSTTSEK